MNRPVQDPNAAHKLRGVCVYCGSSIGRDPVYVEAARKLGRIFAEAKVPLVYGGASIGLMGEIARSVMEHGGRVTGIVPDFLRHIEPHAEHITELIITETMHERKARMFAMSDAFVSLPGGVGTLEETVEMLTWAQLKLHAKPMILVNIRNYWDPLIALFNEIIEQDFAKNGLHDLITVVPNVEDVLPTILAQRVTV